MRTLIFSTLLLLFQVSSVYSQNTMGTDFVFWRALKRTITRAYTKEHVCNGNIESWKQSFFSKESILLWVITTHKKRQREYPILLKEYSHCTIIELRSQEQADELLARVRLTS